LKAGLLINAYRSAKQNLYLISLVELQSHKSGRQAGKKLIFHLTRRTLFSLCDDRIDAARDSLPEFTGIFIAGYF